MWWKATTRSPGWYAVTPLPTAATTPAVSWPYTRGGGSRLCSIFLRSVWQIPQASTRIRISPGPMGGVGISSTPMVLSPRYTAACMVEGTTVGSESTIGNEIPQTTGGYDTPPAQPDQFRKPQ